MSVILNPNIEILFDENLSVGGLYSNVFCKGEMCHIINGTLTYFPALQLRKRGRPHH